MQKVIYTNVYGESVAFSGEPPVLLRSVSGFSRPDAQIISAQGAYQAGATLQRLQLPARSVQVQFDLLPQASREAMYRERMRIERVLSSSRCLKDGRMGLLVYENDAGRWQADAVPDGVVAYGKRFRDALPDGRVHFLCPNPYLLSCEEQTSQMRMGMESFRLPTKVPFRIGWRKFRAALVNNGTADSPVTVTIHGTGEVPRLINHTTGAQLLVRRMVPAGDRLVIHTDPQALSCVLVREDGTVEDAFGYLDPAVAVSAFLLAPGENVIEYAPSVATAGSRADILWHSCYEGV